jgi:hypothetical protein
MNIHEGPAAIRISGNPLIFSSVSHLSSPLSKESSHGRQDGFRFHVKLPIQQKPLVLSPFMSGSRENGQSVSCGFELLRRQTICPLGGHHKATR